MSLKRICPEKLNHLKGLLQKSKIFCMFIAIVGALALTPIKGAAENEEENSDILFTNNSGYVYENGVLTDNHIAIGVSYLDHASVPNSQNKLWIPYSFELDLPNQDYLSGKVSGNLTFYFALRYASSLDSAGFLYDYKSSNTLSSGSAVTRILYKTFNNNFTVPDNVTVTISPSSSTLNFDSLTPNKTYLFKYEFSFINASVEDIYLNDLFSYSYMVETTKSTIGLYYFLPTMAIGDYAPDYELNFHDFIPGSGGGGDDSGEGAELNPNLPDTTLPVSDLSVQQILDTIVYGLNNARSINQIEAYLYMIKDLLESDKDIDFTPIIEALEDIQIDTSSIDDKIDEIIELLESLVPDSDDAAVIESAASGLALADADVDNSQKQILEDIDVADGAIETLADSANTVFAAQTQAISFWLLCLSTFKEYAAVFYSVIVVGLILGMIAFFLRRNG